MLVRIQPITYAINHHINKGKTVQNFLQYNYMPIISMLMLVGLYLLGRYFILKYDSTKEMSFLGTVLKIVIFLGLVVNVGIIISKTFYNQMPKTELNTSAVERSMSKYQESVIRNTNKEK